VPFVVEYVVTPTVPEEGDTEGATVLIGAGCSTDTDELVEVVLVEYVELTAVTTKR
jgi:hypothetical protein